MKELQNLKTSNNKKLLTVLPVNEVKDVFLNECAYSLAKQEFPTDLLVLINGLDDKQIEIVKSILDNPTVKITKKQEDGEKKEETLNAEEKLNYVIEKTEKTTFSEFFNEAFNYAIKNNYEWISPIECEDVLNFKWYKNFSVYSEKKEEIGGFLPINREIANGVFVGFFNEACWGENMAEVAGVFDLQLLLKFNCINFTGGVYKVELLKEYSEVEDDYYKPIKESMKVSYLYEFFLRMIYNDIKFFTIPRVGYERRINNFSPVNEMSCKIPKNLSQLPKDKGGMDDNEIRFWLELAKKEYFFDEDRKETFKPTAENIST